MTRATFPVMDGAGSEVDRAFVDSFAGSLAGNHDLSVEALAREGGVTWPELLAAIHGLRRSQLSRGQVVSAQIQCRRAERQFLRDNHHGDDNHDDTNDREPPDA